MKRIRIAVIGLGMMGSQHAREIDHLENTELAAICNTDPVRAEKFANMYGVPAFYDYKELLENADLDAVLIATPHYAHPPIAIEAFKRGIHVLTEKPIAVHVQAAQEMISGYEMALQKYPDLVFGAVFQLRTFGFWRKIKSLIDEGELGRLMRATWINTDWFRTQVYFDNGGWRATWKGEGGGVLLNQCPHILDLYQWFVGMPKRVAGFTSLGKYHNIEVEDEVTGYFEYENGMVGHFITSTAESPGTNRLEITGEMGKLVFEDGQLSFFRNRGSGLDAIKTSNKPFDNVENWKIDVPYEHHGQPGHRLIIENFANAILNGEELIAPAIEGINSLILGNAIMLSSFQGQPIDLPMDSEAYTAKLQDLIDNSQFEKNVGERKIFDLEGSY